VVRGCNSSRICSSVRLFVTVVALVAAAAFLFGGRVTAENAPDVRAIVEQAMAAAQRAWEAAPQYEFLRTALDKGNTRTYQVTMMLGSPYERLVRIGGQAISESQAKLEQQEFEHELARRRSESPNMRMSRLVAYHNARERDRVMMSQVSSAFDFSLVGRRIVDGRDVYFLRAEPRIGYKPPNAHAEALTGMRGQGWIDVKTYNWAKVSAEVVHPVSIAGILARVEAGTSFELEQMPVDGDIWLLRRFTTRSHSRILLLFNDNSYSDETYSDYRKIASPQE
jgi:hypothetical protein